MNISMDIEYIVDEWKENYRSSYKHSRNILLVSVLKEMQLKSMFNKNVYIPLIECDVCPM